MNAKSNLILALGLALVLVNAVVSGELKRLTDTLRGATAKSADAALQADPRAVVPGPGGGTQRVLPRLPGEGAPSTPGIPGSVPNTGAISYRPPTMAT